MACEPVKNGNVILVEPNCININNNVVNGIPQYQDMYIFAELTAKSKGRTTIIDGKTTSSDSKIVNFIGNNQNNDKNPNYLNFTTNYYDGSNPNGKYYEGFGIENIKISINSSFVPQISIRFIDVRGLAFFNQEDSPYRMLFDFPPPIFTLTVKGQYGKPLTYKLHLVKYTSEFMSSNGNFVIDAQFVAVTFAPLTDILFRYVVNTPLIGGDFSMNPEAGEKPRNTYELILKLKNLYSAISDKLKTDEDNIEYENINDQLDIINLTREILASYKTNENLQTAGEPYLVLKEPNTGAYVQEYNSIPNDNLTVLNSLSEYDNILSTGSTSGTESYSRKRLYLMFKASSNIPIPNPNTTSDITNDFAYGTKNDAIYENPLYSFRERLLGENIRSLNINADTISEPEPYMNPFNVETLRTDSTANKYYYIDVTTFYNKIYRKKTELENRKERLSIDVARKINAMVENRLGMTPSIYNIFEIILNDVDALFRRLKTTSIKAFASHNETANRNIILGDSSYKDNTEKVYSFPLVVDLLNNKEERRVAPIELSKKVPFPELDLVNDFIDTFSLQNKYTGLYKAREDLNDDGVYDWIPVSPLDSTIGGASPENPYIGISNNVSDEMLVILLRRFYVLSQGTIPDVFYTPVTNNSRLNTRNASRRKAYVNLYAESEAINLKSALTSTTAIDAMRVMSRKYAKSFEGNNGGTSFYEYINTISDNNGNLYSFDDSQRENMPISINDNVYVDKFNPNFKGIELISGSVEIRPSVDKSDNPIDNFNKDAKSKGIFGLLSGNAAEYYFDFTKQNLIFIKDKANKRANIINEIEGVSTFSRYLAGYTFREAANAGPRTANHFPGSGTNMYDRQLIALNQGNASFDDIIFNDKNYLDEGNNIINVWSSQLAIGHSGIIDVLVNDNNLGSLLIASNFGFTVSPFNKYPNGLNSTIFDTPAAIEVPVFYSIYIGALIDANENGWIDDVVTFFTSDVGSGFDNLGFYVLADYYDVNAYLSEYDKTVFHNAYQTYMNNSHIDVVDGITNMYDHVIEYDESDREIVYDYLLNPNAKSNDDIDNALNGQYYYVIKDLIARENIINNSQITFKPTTNYPIGYTSIQTLNTDTNSNLVGGKTYQEINNQFFSGFFRKLNALLDDREKEIKEKEKEESKIKGDVDIINQLYYSFKNINDKWLTGAENSNTDYPYNFSNSKLIDMFSFVDRGMNPIGETIINAEILIQMLDDPNISLFTVLSQLLSLNGFEFFPLQNFLRFDNEKSWEDSFKIHTGGYDDSQNTFFVCMYIGGSSSYPSVSRNGFVEDGIIDISNPNVKGFNTDKDDVVYEENIKQEENGNFPWREVRAFRVRFGEQNQSMFKDIKIDSKEYPETNESIQILSRLVGDGSPAAPVPKGQNLYNLYENRSYKATVTGLGNAMIQPTQYFQIENVPMFNGAYIILNVEHNITANHMTTSFSGTKLLKYPMPRVLTPLAFTSYDGLSGGDASVAALRVATQAQSMSPERFEQLGGELGVDVSKAQGIPNWSEAVKETNNSKGVKYAIFKITEGMSYYEGSKYNLAKSVSDAKNNGIEVGFYHFARFDRGTDPEQDGIDDANNCINRLRLFDKPKLPIALDLEEDCFGKGGNPANTRWIGNLNENINIFVNAFIKTMEEAGYKIMIYARTDILEKWELQHLNKYPLWIARYFSPNNINMNVENAEPPLPSQWRNGWSAWQFSSAGDVRGFNGLVDINVIKNGLT